MFSVLLSVGTEANKTVKMISYMFACRLLSEQPHTGKSKRSG